MPSCFPLACDEGTWEAVGRSVGGRGVFSATWSRVMKVQTRQGVTVAVVTGDPGTTWYSVVNDAADVLKYSIPFHSVWSLKKEEGICAMCVRECVNVSFIFSLMYFNMCVYHKP